MKKSFYRGYPIIFINGKWMREDGKKSSWDTIPCNHCKKYNTPEGHDGCLGTLPGVMNACCGHGKCTDSYVQFLNKKSIHRYPAFIILNILKLYNFILTFDNSECVGGSKKLLTDPNAKNPFVEKSL